MNIPSRTSFVLKSIIGVALLLLTRQLASAQVALIYPKTVRGIELSMTKVREALNQNNYPVVENQKTPNDYVLKVIVGKDPNIKPEGYAIRKAGKQFTINAIDASGARYGAFAFAEQTRHVEFCGWLGEWEEAWTQTELRIAAEQLLHEVLERRAHVPDVNPLVDEQPFGLMKHRRATHGDFVATIDAAA